MLSASLINRVTFWSSKDKILSWPHYDLKDGKFPNTGTRLKTIVFSLSYCPYHVSDTSELSRYNSHFFPQRRKLRQIYKMLSHASNLQFQLVLWFSSSPQLFPGLSIKYSLKPITTQKMLNLQITVTRF